MLKKDLQLYKFSAYGFLKNLRFFDAFILLFFRQQGFSFLQIGTLISIREISILIMEIPTGIVADSLGRRSSMIFSFLSYIVSFFIFFFLPRFLFYALAMILFGLGEAFRTGTHKAMILSYLEQNNIIDQKVEYYGFTRSWSQLGSALAALIAGAIVFYSGDYRYIFLGSIVPYIFALLLMISYPKNLDGKLRNPDESGFFICSYRSIWQTIRSFYHEIKKPDLRKAIINSSLYDGLFSSLKDYIQPLLQTFVISSSIFIFLKDERDTVIISIVYFFLFLLNSFSARNSERFSKIFMSLPDAINKSYFIGLLIILLSGVLFIIQIPIAALILFIFFYAFHNLRRPLNVGFISEKISSQIMASGLSVESQMKTLFIAVMSPLMGFLSDCLGIGIAIVILSCLTLLVLPLIKVHH